MKIQKKEESMRLKLEEPSPSYEKLRRLLKNYIGKYKMNIGIYQYNLYM